MCLASDAATKLQYNRARYYDAAVGRWISEDPLGFAAEDANVGRYVGNGITNATDPSGMFVEPAFYRLRRESEPGDYFYPGRNPGEGLGAFFLRSISLTMSNPSFQGSVAIGGPGSNFGGALNQNLRLKPPTESPTVPTNPTPQPILGAPRAIRAPVVATEPHVPQPMPGVDLGTPVKREWGGRPGPWGSSWTREPVSVHTRELLGLGRSNTGQFVSHGRIVDNKGITTTEAQPWDGFNGGGDEVLIPDPMRQVELDAITMPDKPLPDR